MDIFCLTPPCSLRRIGHSRSKTRKNRLSVHLKAGAMAYFKLKDVPELKDRYLLILDKVKHTFAAGEHTMNLEARIIDKEVFLGGIN